ncbi:MAG: hypothetical protein K5930_01800 [Treponemataceae bacterium]|nr:hypothetical protein [Treponemataceae bacterium]
MKNIYHFSAFPDREEKKNNLQFILDEICRLPEGSCAYLKLEEGLYKGQFYFDGNELQPGSSGISLFVEGCGMGKTVISGSLAASEILEDGLKRGTFRTYTAYFAGPRVELRDLTIENRAAFPPPEGIGRKAMQDIALSSCAERMICRGIQLSGHQDTLFLAPLPGEEREKGGFRGPGEFSPRKPTLQLYEDCTISGTVDFVFGGAAALFRNCKFIVRKGGECKTSSDSQGIGGDAPERTFYVAAPCCDFPLTKRDCSSGFFFEKCAFMTDSPASDPKDKGRESVYLARPWRPYGRCFFYDCSIYDGFSSSLWHIWNSPSDMKTAGFYSSAMKDKNGTQLDVDEWGEGLSDDNKKDLLKKIKTMLDFQED